MEKRGYNIVLNTSVGGLLIWWSYQIYSKTLWLQNGQVTQPPFQDLIQYAIFETIISSLLIFGTFKILGKKLPDFELKYESALNFVSAGIIGGVLIFFLTNILLQSLMQLFNPVEKPNEYLLNFFKSWSYLPGWIFLSCVGGGFTEELQRVFSIQIFNFRFGKSGIIGSVLLTSVVFGIGHSYQGLNGVVVTGFTGFLFALFYLRRQNLIEVMIAHSTFDLIGVLLAFVMFRK